MSLHQVDIAGRRLVWREAGDGSPMVLLHAFPLSGEMWAPQLDTPPTGWRVLAPDLRGFGAASGSPATSVDDHVDDVLALMRHLGIERAVIGGLSMGGYVAFALHRRAAQRFRGLVLADTRADADTEQARANRVAMQQTARECGAAAIADTMIPKLLGPASRASDVLPSRLRAIIVGNRVEGIIDGVEALKTRPDSTPTLASITCPTLVVVGADDELTPVAMSVTMHRAIAGSRLAIVPAAGHVSNLEQPSAFNAALQTFLDAI
jgi:3-oxoadipate enol-lactonase